jgi:hypothetical protein
MIRLTMEKISTVKKKVLKNLPMMYQSSFFSIPMHGLGKRKYRA